MTEDEMTGWHHRLNGDEFEQIPGDGEGASAGPCPTHHPQARTGCTRAGHLTHAGLVGVSGP